jgi:hypothetical protein
MTMNFIMWVRDGIALPRVSIYLKVVAVFFLLGALSHVASIMGLVGVSWASKAWYFRTGDLVLLPVNLVIAWGLWRTRFWAMIGWVAAVVFLQAIPILLLLRFSAPDPRMRATWYSMLVVHAVILAVFLLLLRRKKAGDDRRDPARPEGSVT